MKKSILKHVFIVLIIAASCGSEFAGIRPCGAGVCAGLVYSGAPAIVVLPAFVAFTVIFDFSLHSLLYALCTCACVFVAALISISLKRAENAIYAIFFTLSQLSLLFYTKLPYILIIAWGGLSVGVFAAAACFFRPVFSGLKYKLSETEIASGGALLMCASLGLCGFIKGGFVAYFVAAFAVNFAAAISSLSCSMAVAVCFGAGMSLYFLSPLSVALMSVTALISALFKAAPRPISALSSSAAFALIHSILEKNPPLAVILCFTAGSLTFAYVPKSIIKNVRDMLFLPASTVAARGMINRAAYITGGKLIAASRIFYDMQTALNNVPQKKEQPALELMVCSLCPRYKQCLSTSGYKEAIKKMERASAVKGRASVSEIPELLSVCENLPALISSANLSAATEHDNMIAQKARAESREALSGQLGLMANLLKGVGERVKEPLRYDSVKEEEIATELTYKGAAVAEVIVTDESVAAVIESGVLSGDEICDTVSKITGKRYKAVRSEGDVLPGFTLITLEKAPRYDIAFSYSSAAKDEKSGDSHSFVRLGDNRFMMALCDGMGSGEEASKASSTAIELVESFFKAGLNTVSAVESVNRFLALNEYERFSTLDVTVLDLSCGSAEIIKLSAPATVLKTEEGVCAVSGSALPMGVVENVKCSHFSRNLRSGDEIIMATDGITDAFGSYEAFVSAAAKLPSSEPKTEAEAIMSFARQACGGKLKDDATVLCARIYEKR